MHAGALQAVECGIIPRLAMVAGVFVDRFPRRPSPPLAFLLNRASIGQFFIVDFVVGLGRFRYRLRCVFPALVPREQIAEADARMSMGSSGVCRKRVARRECATFASFGRELVDGARALARDRVLRTIRITNATSHFGGAIVLSVFYIFLYSQVHLLAALEWGPCSEQLGIGAHSSPTASPTCWCVPHAGAVGAP